MFTSEGLEEKSHIPPSKNFLDRSEDEIYSEQLGEETAAMGKVAVANQYRSKPYKFLKDLDELIREQKKSRFLEVPSKADLETLTSERMPRDKHADPDESTARTRMGPMKAGPTDADQIPFLNIQPFHIKPSAMGNLGLLEKEIFNELVSLK